MRVRGPLAALLAAVALVVALALVLPSRTAAAQPQILQVAFQSTLLSNSFGQPVEIGATVLLPDSYYRQTYRKYPTIYVVPAFSSSDQVSEATKLQWQRAMRALGAEFIIVFLQGMMNIDGEDVHTEFADSANNGPWGGALTTEFIPATDARFRTIASGHARFLFGHSSGGWSALWLQVNYPLVFNGAWSLSPDPVDFHDFLGPDITKPGQNFYRDSTGHEYGMCRTNGHDLTTLRDFVLRTEGCNSRPVPIRTDQKPWPERQMDTYDDVFSPRVSNAPARLFNRATGTIDPTVAAYWEEHYDVTRLLEDRWSVLAPDLRGKLHVFVGGEDTFHLNGSVVLMREALAKLGSDAEFGIASGADHWQIYDYHGGLIKYSLREMIERLDDAKSAAAVRAGGASWCEEACTANTYAVVRRALILELGFRSFCCFGGRGFGEERSSLSR